RARRVVLGQLADCLEELRAAPVVQVCRGKALRHGAQAGKHFFDEQPVRRVGSGRAGRGPWAAPPHDASPASRTPLNCQRAAGGKKLRYEARMCSRGVAQDPPRRTSWLIMNLPLYSPSAPAGGE